MWWKHHDLASVPSTQGSFSLHTKHIHRPLFGGKSCILKKKILCCVCNNQLPHFFLFFFFHFYFNWALQFKACISIMSCFVSLKLSFLLPKDVFSPPLFTFPGGFWVDVYPNVAAVTACFIIWNWKHKCKVRTNLCHDLAAPRAKLVRWQTAF